MCIYGDEFDKDDQETLRAIFANPARLDIDWLSIVELFNALGALVRERGDRIRIAMTQGSVTRNAILHRPSEQQYASPSTVEAIREFLVTVGVEWVD